MPDQTTDDRILALETELNKLKARKLVESKFVDIIKNNTKEDLYVLYDLLKLELFENA